jgi:hypothetical protein
LAGELAAEIFFITMVSKNCSVVSPQAKKVLLPENLPHGFSGSVSSRFFFQHQNFAEVFGKTEPAAKNPA